eukprot:CAMPEP_0177649362 /NCGR_PEP_ID=MMETSP0447-20121125/11343_1 /TAXON_ID=0 /ORGANISM="Stygamoeba regulata, Strain BSH-02190019" /LENGTH=642 /DNA_ID=CAMNT_0019152109 /DNA_START=133 /DNA_END=2061 /DNA_ORIENTATION=-
MAAEEETVVISPDGRFKHFNKVISSSAFQITYKAVDIDRGVEVAWTTFFKPSLKPPKERLPSLQWLCIRRVASLHSRRGEHVPVGVDWTAVDPGPQYHLMQLLPKDIQLEVNYAALDFHKVEIYQEMVARTEIMVDAEESPALISIRKTWEEPTGFVCISNYHMAGSLLRFVRRARGLDISVIQRYSRTILEALCQLHEREPAITHHAVRASNVFVNGATGTCALGKIGFCCVLWSSPTIFSLTGHPEWMAPDYYTMEEVSTQVDIWAFGLCLLEMITGTIPYEECERDVVQVFEKIKTNTLPASLSKVAEEEPSCAEVIQLCLAFDPAERPTARQLMEHPFFTEPCPKRRIGLLAADPPNLTRGITMNLISLGPNGPTLIAEDPLEPIIRKRTRTVSGLEAPPPGIGFIPDPSQSHTPTPAGAADSEQVGVTPPMAVVPNHPAPADAGLAPDSPPSDGSTTPPRTDPGLVPDTPKKVVSPPLPSSPSEATGSASSSPSRSHGVSPAVGQSPVRTPVSSQPSSPSSALSSPTSGSTDRVGGADGEEQNVPPAAAAATGEGEASPAAEPVKREGTVSLTFNIMLNDQQQSVTTPFDLSSDTLSKVAREFVVELDLPMGELENIKNVLREKLENIIGDASEYEE